jgi:hypothetical protein
MESHEGIAAVVNLGFTERQARFLVLVMQHSGCVCSGSTARSPASSIRRSDQPIVSQV